MTARRSADPAWWQTGVVYQVYPRSFADANGDGVGDLAGIIQHLDHLADGTADSLGVDAIWLSPIYPSPDFDFGYDVADYVGVDPKFGTLADFDRLVEACHGRGIKVILDLVLNHSSHLHPWFESSRASRTGPHADWYIWRDSPGRTKAGRRRPPNNWRGFFGGPAWTWDEGRGQFYLHTFLPQQPDLNWRSTGARAAILDVVRTWLGRGADGFRLDVFNTFLKDAALRSNPRRPGGRGWGAQVHLHDRNQPELVGALAELRAVVDERPGRMTVGELFDGSAADAAAYAAPGHLVFDFGWLGLPWSAAAFREAILRRDAAFGPTVWPANVLSNHDQPRHAGRFDLLPGGEPSLGDARAKVAATLLLTQRGTPFLYYGEEIAMRDLVIPNAQAFDPQARRSSPRAPAWNRDQARGPMPWRGGHGGGFSGGVPWLPLPPDHEVRNVERQASDPDSVLSLYRRLLSLRRATPALVRGTQELVDVDDPEVLAYRRAADGRSALVALNFASRPAHIRLPVPAPGGPWRIALATHPRQGRDALGEALGEGIGETAILAPLEALIAYD